jgi:hypothetical protein
MIDLAVDKMDRDDLLATLITTRLSPHEQQHDLVHVVVAVFGWCRREGLHRRG